MPHQRSRATGYGRGGRDRPTLVWCACRSAWPCIYRSWHPLSTLPHRRGFPPCATFLLREPPERQLQYGDTRFDGFLLGERRGGVFKSTRFWLQWICITRFFFPVPPFSEPPSRLRSRPTRDGNKENLSTNEESSSIPFCYCSFSQIRR